MPQGKVDGEPLAPSGSPDIADIAEQLVAQAGNDDAVWLLGDLTTVKKGSC